MAHSFAIRQDTTPTPDKGDTAAPHRERCSRHVAPMAGNAGPATPTTVGASQADDSEHRGAGGPATPTARAGKHRMANAAGQPSRWREPDSLRRWRCEAGPSRTTSSAGRPVDEPRHERMSHAKPTSSAGGATTRAGEPAPPSSQHLRAACKPGKPRAKMRRRACRQPPATPATGNASRRAACNAARTR